MPLSPATTHSSPPAGADPPARLPAAHGLRGFAALFILTYHLSYGRTDDLPGWLRALGWTLVNRPPVIPFFIVLAGFGLALSAARTAVPRLRGGPREFWRRRALRTLPTYYAAMGLSVVLCLAWVALLTATGRQVYPDLYHSLSAGSLLTHALLIHNFWPHWLYSLNSPLWTLAVIWQLYLAYVALLLPCWRRWGIVVAVVVASLLSLLPSLLPPAYNLQWTRPWYLAIFAAGMAAAHLIATPAARHYGSARTWGGLSAALGLLTAICHVRFGVQWISDCLAGLTCVAIVVHAARCATRCTSSPLVRFFEMPCLTGVGDYSYSLYLTHSVLIGLVLTPPLMYLGLTVDARLVLRLVLGFPLALAAARLFHRYFEAPFVKVAPRSRPATGWPAPLPEATTTPPAP